ncbi:oligoribonuclease [Larsenimonas suaedae]|uniref:Oligoribonuclease n=1 Tax=Larsenimonas suaedae TaxID=1851019 RepID=A0ABU1GZJ9_9GAMM|nr:oligoribonuclease [Larsenimonas suaedae]MCM2972862.1 oligoribonuclease [Larsenimonas suaedae]MDR5896961.1 oligoribonuclease [Larsenimonas suaedae]
MSTPAKDRLIWIDLEMTGLDPAEDRIIEIATIVTDSDLNVVAEGPVLAVHQSDAQLDKMDDWNQKTHGDSGLIERVRQSDISTADAERLTLEFLAEHVKEGASPMCGNSVHQDRRFMQYEMPTLERFFHYRNIDVSTLKELARRWKPGIVDGFQKKGTHQALDDIRESIEEMAYYRTHFLDV